MAHGEREGHDHGLEPVAPPGATQRTSRHASTGDRERPEASHDTAKASRALR